MSLFPTYNRFPLTIVSGKGTKVMDDQGKEYLDFVSGIAVCNLGHRPDKVEAAVKEQMEQVWHVSNLYQIPVQERAAELLVSKTDLDHVFFCNSGAEANEAAIKLARKHTGREKIITFKQSFHGRTFATMSATGQAKIHDGFGSLLPTFNYYPYNDVEAIEEVHDGHVAAIMVEVIQGEGGVVPGTKEFLKAVEAKCDELGALLIIDEVQTGIGRTGRPFAYQHYDLNPDIVTSAKGLGSGFPVGAMLGKAELVETFTAGVHGSTFGGNPLASAAVKATLETIFNDSFLEDVTEKGRLFKQKLVSELSSVDYVKEVRGEGLMLGIALDTEAIQLVHALRESGLLTVLAGPNVLRLLPPLTVSEEEIDQAVALLGEVLKKHEQELQKA
ncbi:acetylornithine transaminase [Halobacillus sp. ACCC02827]|uniref:acetylornithine transaminase n=1 Tax=Bacillaceae TaxID=186817 RepID=UPI0002A4FCA8|nr:MULTISPECIES: acetylornithine transaminase [Bacillaceae]ELK46351.1 acetylornithine aminotransferase [Halobacillus sp. BAB-2008]QHT48346.1 acetylornithine transaminase [Bacillus sp. SB49]WJE15580.1 acetylornithine transaminase [Halobacillus sp. ACCC02827]